MALAVAPLTGCSANTGDSIIPTGAIGGSGNTGAGANTSNGGSIFGSGGNGSTTIPTGVAGKDCQGIPPLPAACQGKAPPGCGDGKINQDSEKCDDHNALAGDGCNGLCQVEPNHVCPTEGQPCIVSFTCGDGIVNPGEVCDQGTNQGSPGCSADCKTQDPGYKCIPGEKCTALYTCGNGRIETGETCDPPAVGNGCGTNCKAETGWRCTPGSCKKLPSCGDGIVQAAAGEKCDQGKSQGSPGCSSDCLSMDATCSCTPGQACVCQKPVCGDGIVQVGEQCDDKNSSYPGCSASCQLEPGYQCPFAGAPCVPVCGDGILVAPAEQCDPAAKVPNVADACYSTTTADATHPPCSVKPGWVCDSASCRKTTCGDGKIEGSEGCDSGSMNNDLGDGCTATCMAEPSCPAAGGACTTKCGDGLLLGSEACDDGNAVSGDGCSATCQVEAGFTCTQPPLGDTMVVPMVVRDFNGGADFEKSLSVAGFATGLYWANQGLLKPTLDSNGLKPQLNSTTGTMNGKTGQDSGIASAASYAQWYSDTATGPNTYKGTLATTLSLFLIDKSDPPTYVNRYGTNGDGLTATRYQSASTNGKFCGSVGQEDHDPVTGDAIPCTFCPFDDPVCGTLECDKCPSYGPENTCATACVSNVQATDCQTAKPLYCMKSPDGKQWQGIYQEINFDGNPLFFPADAFPKTQWNPNVAAQISGNYDVSWPADPVANRTHNFSFTTEARFWFKYDKSKTFKLMFVGDDDVWVFINKQLAVDLGGIHTAVQGALTLTNGNGSVVVNSTWPAAEIVTIPAKTVNLGLTDGSVYEIVVFQAERQTKASSYQLSLSGFNAAKTLCKPVCGGSNPGVSPGEECDNGEAGNCDATGADCYNKCTTECKLGPRCGDGVVQEDHEECDNGKNIDGYAAGQKACSPGCKLPPNCGDGKVQLDYGEECDNGADNSDTLYKGCTTTCKLGPYCGDGIKNGDAENPEVCDDGVNDGTYDTCGVGCTLPPRCGDGVVQSDWGEACEPNASDDPNCTADCRLPGYCGDGVVNKEAGEACDYGSAKNDGSYGGCNSNCTIAPYCGDGVTNGPEECDLGADLNIGDYGGCASTCKLGPHCGDGIPNGTEECDDGSGPSGNGSVDSDCTFVCKNYTPI